MFSNKRRANRFNFAFKKPATDTPADEQLGAPNLNKNIPESLSKYLKSPVRICTHSKKNWQKGSIQCLKAAFNDVTDGSIIHLKANEDSTPIIFEFYKSQLQDTFPIRDSIISFDSKLASQCGLLFETKEANPISQSKAILTITPHCSKGHSQPTEDNKFTETDKNFQLDT